MRRCVAHTVFVACLLVTGCSTVQSKKLTPNSSPLFKSLEAPQSVENQWSAPNLKSLSATLTAEREPEVKEDKNYELTDLIDLAERINPETRVAWAQAKEAAAAVGLVKSQYYPLLALQATGEYAREPAPLPVSATQAGFMDVTALEASPVATLNWVLLDFGRRNREVLAAKYQLLASNLRFNARHQEVAFKVQSSFYRLSTARGRIDVAQSSLDSAVKVQEAAEERFKQGLATAPEVSQARQQAAQATFDFESVKVDERDAKVSLAEAVGILPTTPLQIEDFAKLQIPTNLEDTVENIINRSLEQRPDLLAKVAVVREKEASIAKARSDYYPTLSFRGEAGGAFDRAGLSVEGQKLPWTSTQQPTWGLGLALTWPIFDGGARKHKVEAAEAAREAAAHDLYDSRDKAIAQVWQHYSDTKLAIRRLEVAAVLVESSEKSYQQTFEAYTAGLSNLVELLAARRALSQARFTQLDTRATVLASSAALAFSSGDLGSQLNQRHFGNTPAKQ